MAFKHVASACSALCLSLATASLMAEDGGGAGFGGPDAVENTIEDDARITGAVIKERITQPWFDWKKRLRARLAL